MSVRTAMKNFDIVHFLFSINHVSCIILIRKNNHCVKMNAVIKILVNSYIRVRGLQLLTLDFYTYICGGNAFRFLHSDIFSAAWYY